MSLREDFKHPLDEVNNAFLRRGALILTSFVMIPVIFIFYVLTGKADFIRDLNNFLSLCWVGKLNYSGTLHEVLNPNSNGGYDDSNYTK